MRNVSGTFAPQSPYRSEKRFRDEVGDLIASLTLHDDGLYLLTSHVESHFDAGRHGGIGVRWMDGDASDRLAVT